MNDNPKHLIKTGKKKLLFQYIYIYPHNGYMDDLHHLKEMM